MKVHRSRTLSLFGMAAVLAVLVVPLHAQQENPVNTITAAGLRDRIFFLASDSLGGRHIGSGGYETAAQYAESQFRAAGLVPVAKGNGRMSYLQNVPILKRTIEGEPSMMVKTSKGEFRFAHPKDFKLLFGDLSPAVNRNLVVVFAGYGICEPQAGWDDFRNLDVKDKIVVIRMGAPMRNGKPVLPEDVHQRYASSSSILKKLYPIIPKKPAAIVILPNDEILGAWDALPSMTRSPFLSYDNPDRGALHVGCFITITPDVAKMLFTGQKRVPPGLGFPGKRTTEQGFDLENVTLSITASLHDEKIATWNVAGIVEGTDPSLKNEVVAVTAHMDTNDPEKQGDILNGADDNASGSAAVMEIARAVALRPPKRSILFVLFTAEEGGVIGSRHFVSDCPVELDRIVADVNMDMIGRTAPESEADRSHYAIDSGMITPAFTELIREVNDRTVRWPLKTQYRMGDSDHLIFQVMGIPAVNFYSGHHADVHKATDDAEKIDFEKAQQVTRLVYEVAMELGNRERLWK